MKKITGVNILDDQIEEKLNTRNIFQIFNNFIIPLISKEEQEFLEELEDFLLKKVEPRIDLNKDVYELFPLLGEGDYIQRLNQFGNVNKFGMRYEILLAMATSIIDPELDLARVVSGVIFANPLFQHGRGDHIQNILNEIMSGEKIGAICITERQHGSDAVNMQTSIEEYEDYLVLNGEKVYTTNGSKADYFVVYGVSNKHDPRGSMYQLLIDREFAGIETNRLGIQSIPRVEVSQTIFNSVKVPKEYIIGKQGIGYRNLFSGLVAERDAIIGSSLGISWLTAITALIYTNLRTQFGKPLYDFQAVSFPITQLFTELMAATELGFKSATEYKKTLKYEDQKFIKYNAAFSSGTKFLASNLAQRISYETQQLCGGIAFTDNMRIDKALEVAKVQEIIGGARNIQLYLVSRGIKDIVKRLAL
ncbi:MAG: Acyl-CoA dehydrogenase domain-containing protein [Promethearchaeota archaeon]|jgi:alkylation response protein AidB-like acyl-CoA dehydrogenase|nr:MAG: Acyl-CoA dehydrogenase domain-containing protein [Candidatus Lokiarchaeota archaeon]